LHPVESKSAISLPPLPAELGVAKRPPAIDWLKASDGTKLGYRFWKGDPASPVVLYLHGIEGHSQWFENTATVLNKNGFTIYAPDRRGCGMNAQSRGHVANYQVLLDDLEIMLRHIEHHNANNALFLIANCWAAKLAVIMAQTEFTGEENPLPPITGLILTSPAIYTYVDFPLATKLQIALAWLTGKQQKTWPIPLTTSMLTNNPEYLDYLQKDPLRLTSATASFFVQTFFLSMQAREIAKNIKIPTLILQGGVDEIVDIEKLEDWYEKIATADKAIHVFPEASHTLDFDRTWFKEYTHMLSSWTKSKV